jgi:MFS family permease
VPDAPRPALLTRPFVLAALANLWLGMAASFALHFPGFFQQLGAGEAEIGRIMSVQPLVAAAAGPLFGRMMDRRGPRLVMIAGCTLYLVAASLYLAITGLGAFVYLVRALEGVAGTMLYAALFGLAANLVPQERRTEGFALFGASGLIPMGLSGALGDLILSVSSYRGVFLAAIGFGALGLLTVLPLHDARKPVAAHAEQRSAWSVAGQRDLLPVWYASFAFFFATSALMTFLKTYVLARGHGSVGAFFSVYAGVAVTLRTFFGRLPDRVGPQRMVLPALFAYGAGMALLGASSDARAMLLAAALCGTGHGYAYPVLLSLLVSRARADERGAAVSLYTSLDFTATFLGGPVIGIAIERIGYDGAFPAVCGLLVCGALAFTASDARAPRTA